MPFPDLTGSRGSSGGMSESQFFENYGHAWVCGWNNRGQLGVGDLLNKTTPLALSGTTWGKFCSGDDWTVALKTDGTLWTCGWGRAALGDWPYSYGAANPTFTQMGASSAWADVFTCSTGCYALTGAGGDLWVWGGNEYGSLGLGHTTLNVWSPTYVGTGWSSFAGGLSFVIGIKLDGTLWGCGANTLYSLGLGDTTDRSSFTQIGTDTTWAKVAASKLSGYGIKTDGTLWAWGDNSYGELGVGDVAPRTTPTQVGVSTLWVDVIAGWNVVYALRSDGTVWSWGRSTQYATVQSTLTDILVPTQIGVATDWAAIYGSGATVVVKNTSGDIYVGGANWEGELGLGDTTPRQVLTAQPFDFYALGPSFLTDSATFLPDVFSWSYIAGQAYSDSGVATDTLADSTFTMYVEAIGLADSIAAGANTTSVLTDIAAVFDIIQQAVNQIVVDSAAGADSFNLGAALTLVDIADATAVQAPSYNSVMLVAELIATLETYNGADSYDITDAGVLSDAYVTRVEALVAMIEAAQVVDTNTAQVHVMQLATDSADGAAVISSAGSLLNALLSESALVTIRLNIGGELFTGWVMNADTLAPSEYQFADLQFNSACKHGNTYLLAADDGIYQFTEDAGVETVMTYIKTGKTDFGSDLRKSVINAYMVYSASGQMALKVTTSANGVLQTNDYAMLPFAATDTPDPQRVTLGKGLKSRYWQFELTGANAGCTFDEIGMLPVVLSRRI